MSYRLDTGTILNKPYKHPQGHVRLDCYATKCGVFRYYNADGTHRDELRHPDQVFDKRSLSTLGGVPATIGHPAERVTPKNFDRLGAGTVGDEVRELNPYVRVAVNIQREDAIAAIENGNNQVSLVYETDIIPEVGTFDGIPYTHRQVGVQREDGRYIVYRELGLVQKGRAGDDVKLHLDGFDDIAVMKADELINREANQKPMATATIRLDKAQYEVSPEVATAINAHITKLDSALTDLQGKLQTEQSRATALLNALVKAGYETPEDALNAINALKSQLEEAKGMATAATSEADAAKKEAEAAKAEVGAMQEMAAKQDAADKAKGILPAETKLDGLSSKEIKLKVIGHKYPDIKLDGLSDDALNGMWTVAIRTDSTAPLRQAAQIATTETRLDAAEEARKKMSDRRMKKAS